MHSFLRIITTSYALLYYKSSLKSSTYAGFVSVKQALSKENVLEDKNQNVFELATGIKSWSGFAKKHQLVRVVLTEVYRISKQPRKKDNSFGLDKDEIDKYTIIIPVDTQTSELGRKVLEAFDLK